MSWEIVAVLGIPLFGGPVLALVGDRRWAAEVNVALSVATFVAAAGAKKLVSRDLTCWSF